MPRICYYQLRFELIISDLHSKRNAESSASFAHSHPFDWAGPIGRWGQCSRPMCQQQNPTTIATATATTFQNQFESMTRESTSSEQSRADLARIGNICSGGRSCAMMVGNADSNRSGHRAAREDGLRSTLFIYICRRRKL